MICKKYIKESLAKFLLFITIFTLGLTQNSSLEAKDKFQYELAICAIFNNDAKYLPEWIEFHQKQGVQHFFLYNNLSSDDFLTYLDPYIATKMVTLINWPYEPINQNVWAYIQCSSYMDCIENNRETCHWIAFIDTDEFLFARWGKSLVKVLKDYKKYAGVSVNWVMYGTSGVEYILPHEKMLDKLVMRGYLHNDVNHHVKTIVQPKHVISCRNPHFFDFKEGKFSVTETKKHIFGPFSDSVNVDVLRINHYWQRDLEFFWNVKVARQIRRNPEISNDAILRMQNSFNDEYDDILSNPNI